MPLVPVFRNKQEAERFYQPERDGVTNGLLGVWLTCREKARLFLQGWTPKGDSFAMTFGNVFHQMLEWTYDDVRARKLLEVPGTKYVRRRCDQASTLWRSEHPIADEQATQHFELTMLLVEAILPLYFKYWYKDDFKQMRWEALEHQFRIPITVTGKKGDTYPTFLRGKMDGNYGLNEEVRLRLFETKTKSRVDESTLVDIMSYERQVYIYLSAMRRANRKRPAGVLYNVVRRPQLRQRVNESTEAFAARIVEDIQTRPEWYFFRLQMDVDKSDIDRFDAELNDMVSDFILWWKGEQGHYKNSDMCEHKYGRCAYIRICAANDYSGVYRRPMVFRELEDLV